MVTKCNLGIRIVLLQVVVVVVVVVAAAAPVAHAPALSAVEAAVAAAPIAQQVGLQHRTP